jgi:hypothetical protein
MIRDLEAGFGRMRPIVEPDAHDLVRRGNRRQQAHRGKRKVRLRGRRCGDFAERIGGERGAQGRIARAQARPEIDEAVAADDAVGRAAIDLEAREFHGDEPSSGRRTRQCGSRIRRDAIVLDLL